MPRDVDPAWPGDVVDLVDPLGVSEAPGLVEVAVLDAADAVGAVDALPQPCGEGLGRLQVDGLPLSEVRVWLRGLVAQHGWSPPLERTLLLLATELAANALDHGPAGGEVVLTVQRDGDHLRVAVDDDSAVPPVVRRPPPDAGRGRGMLLVQHLAAAWGTQPHSHGGKVVWFTLPVDAT